MCGNVTLMGRLSNGESAAFPERARQLLETMVRVSQMRGAQSGGAAVQFESGSLPRQLIRKCVNAKRGDLASLMTRTLARGASRRAAFGGGFIVQAHVRYATAGVTTREEAHPFRFVEAGDRGPRRIMTFENGAPVVAERPVETALTHNGDMDGSRFRGVYFALPELGPFLERILGVKNRWVGDSPVLAAAIELFLTKGLWLESLRLAYHLVAAPPPPNLTLAAGNLRGGEREGVVKRLLDDHPAPSLNELRHWEQLAEAAAMEEFSAGTALLRGDAATLRPHRDRLAARLAARFEATNVGAVPKARSLAFARAAVDAFFDNDLYIALRKLEPGLHGTFGCVVTSTLEPGRLLAFSRGQPLSLGFQRGSGTVCVASERAAIKVLDGEGSAVFDERLDLDLCRGEIASVEVDSASAISLTLYGISDDREYEPAELKRTGRLVPLGDNPYVSALPPEASDRVQADIGAVPTILRNVRERFRDPGSHAVQTANAFASAILGRRSPRLLLIGITNDLWLSQQFARNVTALFPGIVAEARSSNEILGGEWGSAVDANTVVLAVSQSGQDFPTLGALLMLQAHAGPERRDAFFVLTGELDSLMGQAVGQSYGRGARFSCRIFSNESGFRPSEAAIATVSATQQLFVELLLHLAEGALDRRAFMTPPHGFTLQPGELQALRARRDACVDRHAPLITGELTAGPSAQVTGALHREARRWSWHVLEGVAAFAIVVLVLELNLQLHLGLVPSRLFSFLAGTVSAGDGLLAPLRNVLAHQADVAFYAFLGPLAIWGLRLLQKRPAFHRQGTRELLIGDVPYVHQIVWLLARRLFGLSYGFASIKPYSANCQDELIMTHEPLRGTLALIGLPDSRRQHLRARGAAAFMTAKQFNNSRSFAGAGAEIVTIGHSPPASGSDLGAHIALPSADPQLSTERVELLTEQLFDSWERLMGMQVFLDRVAREVSRFAPVTYDRSRTKDQVFAPTTAAPVSAASIYQLLSRSAERYERFQDLSLPFEVIRSDWRGSAPRLKTTVLKS